MAERAVSLCVITLGALLATLYLLHGLHGSILLPF
jgi:hypothetical protein